MAGAAIGSGGILTERYEALQKRPNIHIIILLMVISFALFLLVPAWTGIDSTIHEYVIYLFSFINGFLGGSYFIAAVRRASMRSLDKNPALYYSLDLLGGCVGGILGSLILIPAAGIWWTLALMTLIHGAGSVLSTGRISR